MGDKIRIGFCGTGSMGQCAHLKNYYTLPDCEVVAMAELREQTGQAVARRYNIPNCYKTVEEMLAKENLDAIVAAQRYERHSVLLPQLLEIGKPIFIEKPLASTIEGGKKILAAEKKSKGWIMVGYHKQSDPATVYAKEQIDSLKASGELGALKYVRILIPAGDWIAGGFTERIDAGDDAPTLELEPPASDMDEATYRDYSTFVNYYIHQVNLMRHLLGESYKVTYADPSGVLLVGASESGIPCVIEMTPYATTVDWQESALVAFEKGYVKLQLTAPLASNRPGSVEVLRDPGHGKTPEVTRPHLPWTHAMRAQASNFVAAVRGDRKPTCDATEALEDLLVAREYLRLWKGK